MLTGVIVAVVVGLIGAVSMSMRKGKERNVLNRELTARGIQIQQGPAALQVPQTRLLIRGDRPAKWSAHIPGQPALNLYQVGDSAVVVGWRSAVQNAATFAFASRMGGVGNPARGTLTELPKQQLASKHMRLYCQEQAVSWVLSTAAAVTFEHRFPMEGGWYFVYDQGFAYVFAYNGTWAGFDDIAGRVFALEQALATPIQQRA